MEWNLSKSTLDSLFEGGTVSWMILDPSLITKETLPWFKTKKVSLIKVTPRQLGFTENTSYDSLAITALRRGLALCEAWVAPQLYLVLAQLEVDPSKQSASIFVATEPFGGLNGRLSIFQIIRLSGCLNNKLVACSVGTLYTSWSKLAEKGVNNPIPGGFHYSSTGRTFRPDDEIVFVGGVLLN